MDLPVCVLKQDRVPPPVSHGDSMVFSSVDVKEQVRQATDIVDLVGQYLQLRRQGRNYVALCPWHDDSRPSLQVNPERQSWKCWVCDIGGDVFSFLMQMEGIEFREALEMLAERAGIPLRPKKAQHASGGPEPVDKRTLFAAMAWAEAQYHDCLLRSSAASQAREYLASRQITPESIERFHLGFAPEEWDWLQRRVSDSPFDRKMLETVGLLGRSESGRLYDRFRGRVLFSIRDPQGRPVALGGRIMPGATVEGGARTAKYVNSPETPLFTKGNLLYALDAARDALRQTKTALVMEGYTDCIVAHQHGFQNAVAVLGTALGENHVRLLKRFADRIVLVLDGDEAGQRRANEVLELFVAEQADLRILTLPGGSDPCDFLLQRGAAAFAELLEHEAVDALDHAFRVHTQGIDLARDIHAAGEALERLVGIVAKAPRLKDDTTAETRFREQKVLQRLAGAFRIPEEDVRRRMTELRRARRRKTPLPASSPATRDDRAAAVRILPWERELIELLLAHPSLVGLAAGAIAASHLAPGPCRRIYETSCRLIGEGIAPDFDRLMLEFDQEEIKSLLVAFDEQARAKGTHEGDPELLLKQLIRTRERYEVEQRSPAALAALREGGLDEQEQKAILQKLIEQARCRQDRTEPMDG